MYRFRGGSHDGAQPWGLINVKGALYGATSEGGGSGCFNHLGCGTIFSVTPTGKENLLYSFAGGSDGAYPHAALLELNGTLYGTTYEGGSGCSKHSGCGTIFSVTKTGAENVIYAFGGGSDGANPNSTLISVKGILYGTTATGGGSGCGGGGCGTLFSVSTSGKETILHSFGSGRDGLAPVAGVVSVNETLYGTTLFGGKKYDGTVFSATTAGKEKVLHSFGHDSDAINPQSSLLDVTGMLYGTAQGGGDHAGGAVYSITKKGTEKLLYSFAGGSDGLYPESSLIDAGAYLYGTTERGGGSNCDCGTVFSLTTTGTEAILYRFAGRRDGAYPLAALTNVNGTLYGTTHEGGQRCNHKGCGTVFALAP